ncbi:DUF5325 family protein [Caldalkalibacillus salinus]|uniref:DUF5325 family protein n=1 Tax=Caldalkalibacillus salinus TaxID=2803787 RepID=UPI0019230352|nr:DUF5325 family protein [Caldalkalibacillus salinus]
MNWNTIALIFAILAVTCFVLAGIAVAERSAIGFIGALLASVCVMGTGFMLKKKRKKKAS